MAEIGFLVVCLLLLFLFFSILNHYFDKPLHALLFFLKRHQNNFNYFNNQKKWESNLKEAPKYCIFLHITMGTTGARHRMGILVSSVMDIIFHGSDA